MIMKFLFLIVIDLNEFEYISFWCLPNWFDMQLYNQIP